MNNKIGRKGQSIRVKQCKPVQSITKKPEIAKTKNGDKPTIPCRTSETKERC